MQLGRLPEQLYQPLLLAKVYSLLAGEVLIAIHCTSVGLSNHLSGCHVHLGPQAGQHCHHVGEFEGFEGDMNSPCF